MPASRRPRSRRHLVYPLLLVAGCAGAEPPGPAPEAPIEIYQCGSLAVGVRASPEAATLYLPRTRLDLPRVPSPSGARYQAGDAFFWQQGEQARLEVAGAPQPTCHHAPERASRAGGVRPVDFRGLGNEPPWMLEIVEGHSLRLQADYGELQFVTPAPPAEVADGTRRYHAEAGTHTLEVRIRRQACTDSMSGEHFEAAVEADFDGRSFRGCGRWLSRGAGPATP